MANLSDLAAASEPCPPSWIGTLGASRGFVPTPGLHPTPSQPGSATEERVQDAPDAAFAAGYEAGFADAEAKFAAQAKVAESLGLALAKLDETASRALRHRLAESVAALCEQVIEPQLIDTSALEQRCAEALAWTEEPMDRLALRLHPDDIALLGEETKSAWRIRPEAGLPRGTIQLETSDGVIRDGPDEWRRAITEALLP